MFYDLTNGKRIVVGQSVHYEEVIESRVIHRARILWSHIVNNTVVDYPVGLNHYLDKMNGTPNQMPNARCLFRVKNPPHVGMMLGWTLRSIGYVEIGSFDEPSSFTTDKTFKVALVQPFDIGLSGKPFPKNRYRKPVIVIAWTPWQER